MWLLVLLGIGTTAFVLNFTNPYQDIESFEKNFLNVVALYISAGLFFTGFCFLAYVLLDELLCTLMCFIVGVLLGRMLAKISRRGQ